MAPNGSLKISARPVNESTKSVSPSRVWNGIAVRYDENDPGLGEKWMDLLSDTTTVVVRLAQKGGYCEPRLNLSQPTARGRFDAGFFNWIPANHKLWFYYNNARFLRNLKLTFDAAAVSSLLEDEFDLTTILEPRLVVYDSRVTKCAQILADFCIDSHSHNQLFGESLTTALLIALVEASDSRRTETNAHGLSPRQLRISKQYLQENFASDVSLRTLANLAGVSVSRFSRGFKASTGSAPYSWLILARIEKAKDLLRHQSHPISDIAVEVGFADQSHFTKSFRRLVGVTPREWRNEQIRSSHNVVHLSKFKTQVLGSRTATQTHFSSGS